MFGSVIQTMLLPDLNHLLVHCMADLVLKQILRDSDV
jgi:hypothetical protein